MSKLASQYNTIIWDFNGTLLNDTTECINTINELLIKRNLPQLTKERYKAIFGFPVFDYYKKLGFDFSTESWKKVAAEFMTAYHAKENSFSLFENAKETLAYFKKKGYRQYILSAMKTDSLTKLLSSYEIETFFDGVYGLDHHYADGKIALGKEFMAKEQLNPTDCILLGDTVHDAEVADALCINCTLISDGHQSYERLKNTLFPTIHTLAEIRNKF